MTGLLTFTFCPLSVSAHPNPSTHTPSVSSFPLIQDDARLHYGEPPLTPNFWYPLPLKYKERLKNWGWDDIPKSKILSPTPVPQLSQGEREKHNGVSTRDVLDLSSTSDNAAGSLSNSKGRVLSTAGREWRYRSFKVGGTAGGIRGTRTVVLPS